MTGIKGEQLEIASVSVQAGWLIAPRSHLIDRIIVDCEHVWLPPKVVPGGTISWQTVPQHAAPAQIRQGLGQLLQLKRLHRQRIDDGLIIDLRLQSPGNWAHFLNNHLPIVFQIAQVSKIAWKDLLLLLPAQIPGHIKKAAELFGFRTLCTDSVVEGAAVTFVVTPWTAIRPVRADWVRGAQVQAALMQAGIHTSNRAGLPKRAFISRRGARTLENEAEVADYLEAREFQLLYAEDLSVTDQFRLFEHAEVIVAIHGAALAPLLYRSEGSALKQVIELFPCGHMTDNFRVMAEHVGCAWIGVRGKIKPEHLDGAYTLDQPFLRYSLQSFEVDTASIERAFVLLEEIAS